VAHDLPVLPPGEKPAPGTIITGFQPIPPVSDAVCRAQIAASMARGLPEAVAGRSSITIVANGPSAHQADLAAIKGPTLAVNGSIQLFLEKGLAPTYWAACDPQALVADFLPDEPPAETVYFVASKCHPAVFEKLKNRKVLIWHLADFPVEGRNHTVLAPTITICAAWLMYRQGFTDFEFWGWDGCFMDGQDHAAFNHGAEPEISIIYGAKLVDGQAVGGRKFPTTRSWAAESHGAEQFFQLAVYFDIGVKVHGDGMFACAIETMREAA
jgi:hypothetical protein